MMDRFEQRIVDAVNEKLNDGTVEKPEWELS